MTTTTSSGHSSGSVGGVCTVMAGNCKATKQINRNKKAAGDSPPTYSLAQQHQQGHYHPRHDQQHQIHLVSGSSGGSPSNLHNSASVAVSINTQEQQQHHPIVDLYHQQQVSELCQDIVAPFASPLETGIKLAARE